MSTACIAWQGTKMCLSCMETFNAYVARSVIPLQKHGVMILRLSLNVRLVEACCDRMLSGLAKHCRVINSKPQSKLRAIAKYSSLLAHQESFSLLRHWHMPRAIVAPSWWRSMPNQLRLPQKRIMLFMAN